MTISQKGLHALCWTLPGVLILAAVALPTAVQAGFIGAVLVGVLVAALPVRASLFIWAALLPIWSIGSVNPLVFDAARIYIAIIVFFKLGSRHGSLWTSASNLIAIPLTLVAITVALAGFLRPDATSLSTGVTMAVSLVTARMILSRTGDPLPLLGGYLFGVVASACVLILAALGYSTVTPQVDGGYFRLTGLSPSATLVTYQLAIGVVIAWALLKRSRKRAILYTLALLACLAALALSGGRGGVLALLAALLVAVRWRWFKVLPTAAIAGVAMLALSLAETAGITVNTVQRIVDSAQSGETDSRYALLIGAIDSVAAHPILGSGIESYRETYGLTPHFAILTFYVAGGILCGVLILWCSIAMLVRVAFISPQSTGVNGKAAHLLLAVLIIPIFLEPSGPFVGIEFTSLILLAIGITSDRRPNHISASDQDSSQALSSTNIYSASQGCQDPRLLRSNAHVART